MKEQNDILEDLFREGLQDLEIPVSENLWVRIKKSISEKKKRRFFFWLFFGVLLVSGITTYVLLSGGKEIMSVVKKNTATAEKQISENKSKSAINFKEEKTAHIAGKDEETPVKKIKDEPAHETKSNNEIAQQKENVKTVLSEKAPANNIVSLNENKKSTSKKDPPSTEKIGLQKTSVDNTKTNGKNESNQGKKISKENDQDLKTMSPDEIENTRATVKDPEKFKEAKDTAKTKTELPQTIASTEGNTTENKSDSLQKEIKDSASVKLKSDNVPSIAKKDSTKESKIKMFMGIDGGTLLNQSSYSNQYDPSFKFKNLPGTNFSGYFGLSFKEKLNISIGLGFINLVTNYERTTNHDYKDSIQVTKIDSFGPVLVDSTFMVTKRVNEKGKISTTHILIPIKFEYVFRLGNKFKLIPSVGIAYDFINGIKASIQGSGGPVNPFSYSFGLKISYALTKKWQVYLGSEYGKFIKPFYTASDAYDFPDVLPAFVTLNGGIRYNFGTR